MPYVSCNNINIYYERMGVGAPVIFLHSGFSRGILAFASQILDFQRQYTCYFPDFRGHGRTRSGSLEWSTPQHADDIIAFMDHLHIDKAHLIGYGMGGGVSLHCAVNQPVRVATLTSIGQCGFVAAQGSEEFEPESLLQHKNYAFIDSMKERHFDAHQGNWQQFLRQKLQDWRTYP
ncbi:MAG: alpha/beta hydrolase, partial [Paenibacillus sp.]|nr:alpha/beta hydrolase [Paenibacillus sp.]